MVEIKTKYETIYIVPSKIKAVKKYVITNKKKIKQDAFVIIMDDVCYTICDYIKEDKYEQDKQFETLLFVLQGCINPTTLVSFEDKSN